MESFGILTSFFAFLSPVAFVFAIAAISYYGKLNKEIKQLKKEIEDIKNKNI